MQPDVTQSDVRAAVMACLEKIVDPCSVASGVPAGLVSMGLVGPIEIEDGRAGAKVHVTLYITEPGCLMGSLFELTAVRALNELPGIAEAEVAMDYDHFWGPERMGRVTGSTWRMCGRVEQRSKCEAKREEIRNEISDQSHVVRHCRRLRARSFDYGGYSGGPSRLCEKGR